MEVFYLKTSPMFIGNLYEVRILSIPFRDGAILHVKYAYLMVQNRKTSGTFFSSPGEDGCGILPVPDRLNYLTVGRPPLVTVGRATRSIVCRPLARPSVGHLARPSVVHNARPSVGHFALPWAVGVKASQSTRHMCRLQTRTYMKVHNAYKGRAKDIQST